jgi:hypothetical protein
VGWTLTATNAQDQVTSERGGPSPYRAVEPWLLLLLLLLLYETQTNAICKNLFCDRPLVKVINIFL